MSAYKSFAVVGAGRLGSAILAALAAQNAPVILLSRSGSSKTVPSGVTVVQVDYTDAAAVAAVFREHKVDVVLARHGGDGGAEAAGGCGETDRGQAVSVRGSCGFPPTYLKNIGIPSTVIHTGFFIEYIPMIAGCLDAKIRIVGDGEAPISFTSIADIAESELENHILRLEGERASWNEVAAQFKATVERRETTAGEAGDMLTTLLSIVARGGGSTGWGEASQREGCGRDAAGAANAL
ncbi:hypothetical protein B0H14DRAFT_2558825 [Mycena olivaceomarginata]|nr:hypothetical protein B0H14DRAFT_2558825 [Mycena olivaceomarginata]